MNNIPVNGEIYKHKKGNLYKIMGVGKHTETEENFVIYTNLDDLDKIWIRPLDMFMDEGRFEKINE